MSTAGNARKRSKQHGRSKRSHSRVPSTGSQKADDHDAAVAVAAHAEAVRAVDEALAIQQDELTLDSFWKARTVSMGDASMHDRLELSSSIFILAMTAVPALGCVLLFSASGYGVTVYTWLVAHEDSSNTMIGLAMGLLLLLYLADFTYWQLYWQGIKDVLLLLVAAGRRGWRRCSTCTTCRLR